MTEQRQQTQIQNYLKQVFSLNPVYASAQLLELRRKSFRRELPADRRSVAVQSVPDLEQKAVMREQISLQLKRIQSEFWTLPHKELSARLDSVKVAAFPEFRTLITRLKIVAACRSEFQKLLASKGNDIHLVSAFQSAVILPPDKATGARERFLRSLTSAERIKRVKATAKLIQSQYPVLFNLEKDWFTTILKHKRLPSREKVTGESGFLGSNLEGFEWVIAVLLFILIRVLLLSPFW